MGDDVLSYTKMIESFALKMTHQESIVCVLQIVDNEQV